jgi:hypothetical protein
MRDDVAVLLEDVNKQEKDGRGFLQLHRYMLGEAPRIKISYLINI